MNDVGHVVTNNDNNIVYNDQPYCYSNNIFCYNKVFLIIIKMFYCNKIFVAIVYCHRFYGNCGQHIFFFVAIEVYCNNLNFIATKTPKCKIKRF